MAVTEHGGQLVVRPSFERYKTTIKAAPVGMVFLVALFAVRAGLIGLVIGVATAGVALALVGVYMRRARVIVSANEIGKVGLLARSMRPRSDIAEVVTATIAQSLYDTRQLRHLFVLDEQGRSIININDGFWTHRDMHRIVEQLGVTPTDPGVVITMKQLVALHPKAVWWGTRHPVLTAMLILAVVLVATSVAVTLTM